MKKITTLALCLLMALSMASCSNQAAKTEENSPATFDSSWADNEYAALIPEPPMYEYSTEIKEEENYTLCSMMNTASPTADYLHITEDTFFAYMDQLQEIGYNENIVNMKTHNTCIVFSAWKDNVQVAMEYNIWNSESGYISFIDIYKYH